MNQTLYCPKCRVRIPATFVQAELHLALFHFLGWW